MTVQEVAIPSELTAPGPTRAAVEALGELYGAPDWVRERRLAAWDAFERIPMPSRRDEHWRFTNLRTVRIDDVQAVTLEEGDEELIERAAERAGGALTGDAASAGKLLHVNGTTQRATTASLPDGVIFTSLELAMRDHESLVRRYLGTAVSVGDSVDDKFVALQEAFLHGGAFLYVPRNTRVELPFHADVVHATAGGTVNWRALVVLDEGAEATFVEEYISLDRDAPGFSTAVVELVAGPGSHLNYVTIQDYARPVAHFATHRVLAERDATVEWAAVGLGASLGKSRMEARLLGAGSNVRLTGAYFLDGSQELDYDTQQFHEAPNALSDLAFKGVLTDRARSVWRGMIDVAEGAQGTDAYQENRNLMLSPRAHADSIPGLQIEANEVRCTHGSTTGKVDPEQLFYLQARGISRDEAIRAIVRGFFVPVLDRIPNETVRDGIQSALWARMDPATQAAARSAAE